jgi:alpha-D-xyloside xylohydrolase
VYVRPGAVIPWGARDDRPNYDFLDGLTLRAYGIGDDLPEAVTVVGLDRVPVSVPVTDSNVEIVSRR